MNKYYYESVTIVLTRKRPEVGHGIKILLVAVARGRKWHLKKRRGGVERRWLTRLQNSAGKYPHDLCYLRASDVVCLYVDTVPFLLLSV